MRSLNVLIVDDEPAIRQILSNIVEREGHQVTVAENGTAGLECLMKQTFDLAISDVRMPDFTGIELLKKAREQGIETQFIIMTAYASVNTAIEAMRAGAYDYMMKPLRHEDVKHRLNQLSNMIGLKSENQVLQQMVMAIGDKQCQLTSPAMLQIERLILKVAKTNSTVLITGSSGTGKGITARSIHRNSPRADGPFIPVNCGAIPENLIESELFGHDKGAFSGASKVKKGLFEEAQGGTLFLDEMGDLPLHLQVKLLHAIEEKRIRPVGSEQFHDVDIRIVAATNRDLEAMVKAEKFREDLYFRLNIFNIHLPALKERLEDVSELLHFFVAKEAKKLGLTDQYTFDPEALELLEGYHYPGNVRELENIVARALILAEDEIIRVTDLPQQVISAQKVIANANNGERSLREQVRLFEIQVIEQTIHLAHGDRRQAAKLLGLGLSSLYRKIDDNRQLQHGVIHDTI
jgi:two-component system response regulator AtoC